MTFQMHLQHRTTWLLMRKKMLEKLKEMCIGMKLLWGNYIGYFLNN